MQSMETYTQISTNLLLSLEPVLQLLHSSSPFFSFSNISDRTINPVLVLFPPYIYIYIYLHNSFRVPFIGIFVILNVCLLRNNFSNNAVYILILLNSAYLAWMWYCSNRCMLIIQFSAATPVWIWMHHDRNWKANHLEFHLSFVLNM